MLLFPPSYRSLHFSLLLALTTTALLSPCPFPVPIPRTNDGSPTGELIGDLLTGITTPTGQLISDILVGGESGQSSDSTPRRKGQCPLPPSTPDPCCVWYDVSTELTKLFLGRGQRCNDMARAAIRLGFHDAGTWSKSLKASGQDFGGADGSLLLGFGEDLRSENNGLQNIINSLQTIRTKYHVGAADLVQFAANHATVTCPLGPRIRTFIGRKDATRAAPNGLLPGVNQPADDLLDLFRDKTIGPHELAALLGAHTTSKQFFVDSSRRGATQDSTPGVWDVRFYNETIQAMTRPQVYVFSSDARIAVHPDVSDEWDGFVGDQGHWNEDYATAYIRLSLLGVNNINRLTECTAALPAARLTFDGEHVLDADE